MFGFVQELASVGKKIEEGEERNPYSWSWHKAEAIIKDGDHTKEAFRWTK